jgi:hypothetical protein
LVLLALLPPKAHPPEASDAPAMMATLVDLTPTPVVATSPSPAKPPPQRSVVRPTRAPPQVDTLPADEARTAEPGPGLTDAQLAGASDADSRPAGGPCDMARWLQTALRKDPLVQAAVAGSAGKAIMVWNGDWVRSSGEDGKGLAAVREAIMWEVAFAPEACRSQAVHGLVLFSMNKGSGARLAVGSGQWRWSDLLRTTSTVSEDASLGQ